MANMYGINLADVYRNIESIKGQRQQNRMAETQNKLSDIKLSETQREISERPAREQAAKSRENMLLSMRGQAATGDISAQQRLLAVDPEGMAKFIDAASKMNETQLNAAKRSVDEIGKLSHYVLQGKTPEEQNRRYSLMMQSVSPDVKSKLPEQFDPQFMQMSLAKATSMDKILENPKSVRLGNEDILYKGGNEIERANVPIKEKSGKSGGGLDTAGESLMYKQSVELLGGLFDQQGNITNLDPDVRNKVQGIATEATKIFKERGDVSRTEAVKLAALKYGLSVPEGNGSDPLGIRSSSTY